jgi:menaquinone-dependent protoporphyrinogen oxidase
MPRALIVYATTHGHTGRIAARLATALETEGLETDHCDAGNADPPAPSGYDVVLVGASVHAGHHQGSVVDWCRHHAIVLGNMPSAFFSVCLTAADDTEESHTATRRYLDEFVERTGWTPAPLTTFAGALQYREYSFATRLSMRLLMARGGRPTDTRHDYDYTDWDAVDAWARACAELVERPAEPALRA